MSSVAVDKFGVVGKNIKMDNVSPNKDSTVFDYSGIGTVALLPLTMFQLLTRKLLPL